MRSKLSAAVAAVAMLAGVLGTSAAAGSVESIDLGLPDVIASGKCSLTLKEAQNMGTTYVFSLSARGVGCDKGKRIVRSYHECRHDQGGKRGKCKKKVKGFKCNEGKRDVLKGVQYDAKATCKKGNARVAHSYQQAF